MDFSRVRVACHLCFFVKIPFSGKDTCVFRCSFKAMFSQRFCPQATDLWAFCKKAKWI